LTANKYLEEINFNNCKIEPYAAKMIGLGLKKNIVLKRLYLSGNGVGAGGVEHICNGLLDNINGS
jgi:hypothetical protein